MIDIIIEYNRFDFGVDPPHRIGKIRYSNFLKIEKENSDNVQFGRDILNGVEVKKLLYW